MPHLSWKRVLHAPRVYKQMSFPTAESRLQTYRAWVPGGWLVCVWADVTSSPPTPGSVPAGHWGGGLTFVPDPNHEWETETED